MIDELIKISEKVKVLQQKEKYELFEDDRNPSAMNDTKHEGFETGS